MKKEIHLLQIGPTDWSKEYRIPDTMTWEWISEQGLQEFLDKESAENKSGSKNKPSKVKTITALFVTGTKIGPEITAFEDLVEVYSVFYPSELLGAMPPHLVEFLNNRLAQEVDLSNPQALIREFSRKLFIGQYGGKLPVKDLVISPQFTGIRSYEGNRAVRLEGNFHQEYRSIASYRYGIPLENDKDLVLWPEIQHDPTVEIRVNIRQFSNDARDTILAQWSIDGQALDEEIRIDPEKEGVLSLSIQAKGYGVVAIGPLHYRFSRGNWGTFLLGGERFSDSQGQEMMTYFHPGDRKPPLNVYFAGYHTAEGFEGFYMMKKLGAPFLLITDPRLEGGAFYIGSSEIENYLQTRIQDCLKALGFTNQEMILSGLSMGTYGALYYGTKLHPYAMIVGKPIVNLGTMAKNEKTRRPGGFPTSLDLLLMQEGKLDQEAIDHLDNVFWSSYRKSNLTQTRLAIAYMKDDDYDQDAFEQLVQEGQSNGPKVIGKGWIGRHNDNSDAVINWFIAQYQRMMQQDFGRNSR